MAGKRQSDLTGQTIGDWNIKEYIGKNLYNCECLSCHTDKEISGYAFTHNQIPTCTCKTGKTVKGRIDLTGQFFGDWKVLYYGPNGSKKWMCECQECGTQRLVPTSDLRNGKSTGCGCKTNRKFENLKGKIFNDWEVLDYNTVTHKWICKCSCGTVGELTNYALKSGSSKSCGHNTSALKDLTGMDFGYWHVIKRADTSIVIEGARRDTMWVCKCTACNKVTKEISSYNLRSKGSLSCGCMANELREKTCIEKYGVAHPAQRDSERTEDQIAMTSSKDNLINAIKLKFNEKPSIYEVSVMIGLTRATTKEYIHKYEIEEYVVFGIQNTSGYEKWINSLFPCEVLSDRSVLKGKELDLYYTSKGFAIEFNGNYWHSELYKDKQYHKDKVIQANKKHVQVFNIFEYEWNNKVTREKIIRLLKNRLYGDRLKIVGARECKVMDINDKEANEFIEKYHLQGKTNAQINIGMFYNNTLIGVMTLGKPRFNSSYDYEIIRLAWMHDIAVIGGSAKLFNYFVKKYNPQKVITYCDISKFTGNGYTKFGFIPIEITEPNYKWVDVETNEVISRYKASKKILVEKGWGTEDQTEVEIMHEHGFLRIYDCGNLKLEWIKNKQ